jgi:LPS-assembly lipoprotein
MTENRRQRTDKRISGGRFSFPAFCLLSSVVCLLGCGFHSVYGSRDDGTPVAAELNQVAIDNIPDRYGQMLRNELIDRMYGKGRPPKPAYHLEVRLRETEEGIGLLPNAITTLTELNLYADYSLKDPTGKAVVSATAHAVATFNQLQQEYGTLAADEGAHQRTINEIAQQIVERVSLYFSEGTTIKPAPPSNPVLVPNLVTAPPP